jgi:hypothetical protein
MIRSIRSLLAVPFAVAALTLGAVVPASAQQQEGLINVNVSDVDVGVIANVQVPVAIAANVCGVAVNVLARQLPGDVECDAEAQSAADNEQFMQFAERQGQAEAIRDAVN